MGPVVQIGILCHLMYCRCRVVEKTSHKSIRWSKWPNKKSFLNEHKFFKPTFHQCLSFSLWQAKKKKNISHDAFGTKFGRVHMQKQDLSKLHTRKMKGLRKRKGEVVAEDQAPKMAKAENWNGFHHRHVQINALYMLVPVTFGTGQSPCSWDRPCADHRQLFVPWRRTWAGQRRGCRSVILILVVSFLQFLKSIRKWWNVMYYSDRVTIFFL